MHGESTTPLLVSFNNKTALGVESDEKLFSGVKPASTCAPSAAVTDSPVGEQPGQQGNHQNARYRPDPSPTFEIHFSHFLYMSRFNTASFDHVSMNAYTSTFGILFLLPTCNISVLHYLLRAPVPSPWSLHPKLRCPGRCPHKARLSIYHTPTTPRPAKFRLPAFFRLQLSASGCDHCLVTSNSPPVIGW